MDKNRWGCLADPMGNPVTASFATRGLPLRSSAFPVIDYRNYDMICHRAVPVSR